MTIEQDIREGVNMDTNDTAAAPETAPAPPSDAATAALQALERDLKAKEAELDRAVKARDDASAKIKTLRPQIDQTSRIVSHMRKTLGLDPET